MSSYANKLVTFLACCLPVVTFAYNPPVGIPDPIWGSFHPIDAIAPSQPIGWPSSEVVNYYYIDKTHPLATDTGNTYGFPDKPRATIPNTTYAAGAYIEINGAQPYDLGAQLIFTANGTEAEPVWFRGSDKDNPPTIQRETIVKGSYVIIENLKWDTNRKTLALRSHSGSTLNNVAIRNCRLEGPGTETGFSSAINIQGKSSTERFSNFVVYNNVISSFGDSNETAIENDYHGVAPHTNVDYVWILENKISGMGGDSVQVGTASTADVNRVSHVYIGANEFHGDRENAVDVKEADIVVISSNKMYDYEPTSSSGGGVIVIHNDADKIYMINNDISDGNYGIINTAATNTWTIGNVIHNIKHNPVFEPTWNPNSLFSGGAAIHYRGESSGGIVNNTIFDYETGMQLVSATSGTGYTVQNNILLNRSASTAQDIATQSDIRPFTHPDNNIFYHSSGAPAVIAWGTDYTLAGFQTIENKCLLCTSGSDPLVELTSSSKLGTIPFNSVAFGAGADIDSVLSNFQTLIGVSIDKDLHGNARKTQAMDIGAFEYPSPTSLPAVPSSVSVTVNN